MPSLAVRSATSADAGALADLYRRAYQETVELGFPMKAASATVGMIETWLDDGEVFVGVIDDGLVASVRMTRTDPDRMKLSRLAVDPAHQGEGFGARLIDHVESVAADRGCAAIWLTTPPDHPYLPALYRDRGYVEAGEYPLPNRPYDEIILEKSLR